MAGRYLEPFPRQTLMGLSSGSASYWSEPVDLKDYPDLAWSIELSACLPATVTNPATVYFESSMSKGGDWSDLLPSGESPSIGGTSEGILQNTGRFVRVRVDVVQDETVVIAVRLVARRRDA